ncbi:hypothetical protein [Streptomyces sp. RFCAC02]|uniref:hypothetical protein n=1 Tax=Streptomyces sp. RFCAC02 TaxID=2499143 RepID=UPI00143D4625|nr:hypothetical protein [Streptomyces sp. RFCAC02]
MPNSFSRFLNDEELKKVRELYLASLQEAEQDKSEDQQEKQEKQAGSGSAETTTEV